MKRAVIYTRYSAGPNQTDMSIEGQVRECKKYIESKGYILGKIYADKHISGKTDNRPEFQNMISDAEKEIFDVVVVYSLDRFSRDKYDSVIYKKELRKHNIVVESSQEHIPEGPEGILMESMLEGLAMYYSAELSRKIKRGMHDAALKARSTGASIPRGYKVGPDKKYIIDELSAPYIKEAFNMRAAGKTYADIARYLNSKGLKTPKGNDFSYSSVYRLLQNRKYIGEYRYMDIVIEDGIPAIVDKEVFDVVQSSIISKEHIPKPKGDFALTGKLFCGKCGTAMNGTSGTGKTGKIHYYYRCPGKDRKNVNRDLLENYVAAIVKETFKDSSELDELTEKLFALQLEEMASEDDVVSLSSAIKGIDIKINNIIDKIEDGIASDQMVARLEKLEVQKADLAFQLDLAKAEKEKVIPKELIRKGLEAFVQGLIFSDEETATKKIIEAFVHRVYLYDDNLLVEFNIQGLNGLKKTDAIEFDQTSLSSTIRRSGRTLVVLPGALCIYAELDLKKWRI